MKTLAILIILLGLLPIGLFFVGPIPMTPESSKQDFSFLMVSKEGIIAGVVLVIGGIFLLVRDRLRIHARVGHGAAKA